MRSGVLLHADNSTVTFTNAASGDMQIEFAGSSNGAHQAGKMIVVGGRILVANGLEFRPGAEIDTLDAPTLEVQLALKLLSKAVPGGPTQVKASQVISLEQQKDPIEVATPSASGAYAVPWSLTGRIVRGAQDRLSFTLTFTCKEAPGSITIAGMWEKTSPAPVLPDNLSLVGWRAFKIGPYTKQQAGGTIFDYGAQELPNKFETLGQARAAAAKTGA